MKKSNFSKEFEYVVERKPPAPICFGSNITRDTNPIGKGLSPFQKRLAPEILEIGPGQYDTEKHKTALDQLLNKVRSNKGVGPLTSDDPRFKDKILIRNPSPTRYNVDYKPPIRVNKNAPFGTRTRRLTISENKLPGPGTYVVGAKKCRRTRFMYNFGRPGMIPTIEINCVSRPSDTCVKCDQLCTGDYWHLNHAIYLCHLCWEEEKRGGELYDAKQLKTFAKIRNCSFTHSHEGTTAAIRLLSPKKIKKKLRLENYLDLYIEC